MTSIHEHAAQFQDWTVTSGRPLNLMLDDAHDGDHPLPANKVELLERGLEYARDEARWCSGTWMRAEWEDEEGYENGMHMHEFKDLERDPLTGYHFKPGVTCGNIQACAMGILVLATYNGPLIRAMYGKPAEEGKQHPKQAINWSRLCSEDPIIGGAARFLAAAMRLQYDGRLLLAREAAVVEDVITKARLTGASSAVDEVVSLNDGAAEHAHIVAGFELALEAARRDSAS